MGAKYLGTSKKRRRRRRKKLTCCAHRTASASAGRPSQRLRAPEHSGESNIDKLSLAGFGTLPVGPLKTQLNPNYRRNFHSMSSYIRTSGCLNKGRGKCLFDLAFHQRLGNVLSSPRRRGKRPSLDKDGTGTGLMNMLRCVHTPTYPGIPFQARSTWVGHQVVNFVRAS